MANAYDLLMQELQQRQPAAPPMFTPEQIQQRLAQNNQQVDLGVWGQLAGDQRVRGVGGQVFKNALGARDPRITNRGMTDPLTGETTLDPAYVEEREEQRRGRVLQQALGYESKREAEEARKEAARENRAFRLSLANIAASNRNNNARLPKPPSGYRYTADGELEAIPGGPAAAKTEAQDAAKANRLAGINQRVDQIKNLISKAREQVGPFTTGLPGSVTSKVPGGTAYDLRRTVDSIKANIGFQELQAMREASPTGGALGQVAVQELNFLQSVLGSLDPNQSEQQLRDNLDSVETHMENWRNAVQASSSPRSGGASSGWDSPTTPPAPGRPTPAPASGTPAPATGGQRLRWDGTKFVPQ